MRIENIKPTLRTKERGADFTTIAEGVPIGLLLVLTYAHTTTLYKIKSSMKIKSLSPSIRIK